MQDFEVFEEALSQDTTYMSSLTRSMSLVLDEFYQNLRTVGVSSMTGAGFDEFLKAFDDAEVEFETQYKPGKPVCDVIAWSISIKETYSSILHHALDIGEKCQQVW